MGLVTRQKIDSRSIDYVEGDRHRPVPVTATRREYPLTLWQRRFVSPSGSHELAVNGSPIGGSSLSIWDGTGAGDTGADWTRGGVGTESAAAMHSGTNGLDTGVMAKDDLVLFDTTAFAISHQSLVFWLNAQAFPVDADIELRWQLGGSDASDKAKVNDYITVTVGTWQQVVIPIVDFNVVGNVDRLRLKHKGVAGQHIYYDDFQLSSGGGLGVQIYRVEAPTAKTIEVENVRLMIAGTSAGWLIADWTTIDGGLSAGLLLRYWDYYEGDVFWSYNFTNNKDLFGLLRLDNSITFLDADRMITLLHETDLARPILQEHRVLDLVVRDDLSSLISINAWTVGGVR